MIRDGKVPTDWEQSFIVCLYKGKIKHLTVSLGRLSGEP